MILVWRGWGIVVIAIAFVWLSAALAFAAIVHADTGWSNAIFGLGLIPAGIMTWYVGRRMNRDATRILIDPATGGEVVVRRDHSFFFGPGSLRPVRRAPGPDRGGPLTERITDQAGVGGGAAVMPCWAGSSPPSAASRR